MAYKSPGVYGEERALRFARRNPSAIRAAFAGKFSKGPVGYALPITDIRELETHFGTPNDLNYNDFFQVARFLEYHPGIFVSRAANLDHTFDACADVGVDVDVTVDVSITSFELAGKNPFGFKKGDIDRIKKVFKKFDRFTISGDNANNGAIYTVLDVDNFVFVPKLKFDVFKDDQLMRLSGATNASVEMPTLSKFNSTPTSDPVGTVANEAFIESPDAFDLYSDSYAWNDVNSPMSFWARSPGSWGNSVQIAIVKPEDFKVNYSAADLTSAKLAFDGVVVDQAFRQPVTAGNVGVLVALDGQVVEQFVGTENRSSKGSFIVDEINLKSNYIFARRGIGTLWSTAFSARDINRPLQLLGGLDAEVSVTDIENAYKVFEDQDTYKFDVVIANEMDEGLSAVNLARARGTVTAIVGAPYNLFASKNPIHMIDAMVDWRESMHIVDGSACCGNQAQTVNAMVLKYDNAVIGGNYLAIYDTYNNKHRLINVAGDLAGVRCETNDKHGAHKASAGVRRGVLKPGARLIFNPSQAHRDILYSHNINPIVAMNGVGNVVWGNRTLAEMEDPFISWHVRSMTNAIVQNASSVLRQFVMENINHYVMQGVVSSLSPMLNSFKAEGGLQDFYVDCSDRNNSPETMANNELIVDVYILPTGVAEYIRLRVTNTGFESIATVMQREDLRR